MKRGLTLIELLIAVSLISILAAIGVPNFLDAQVRSKIARTHADMAVIMGAIEMYHVDHHAYPPNLPQVQTVLDGIALTVNHDMGSTMITPLPDSAEPPAIDFMAAQQMGGFPPRMYGGIYGGPPQPPRVRLGFDSTDLEMAMFPMLAPLTTPTVYLPSILTDPFARSRHRHFLYVNWTGESPGGLTYHDARPRTPVLLISNGPDNMFDIDYPTNIGAEIYDTTNGTVSGGDFYENTH